MTIQATAGARQRSRPNPAASGNGAISPTQNTPPQGQQQNRNVADFGYTGNEALQESERDKERKEARRNQTRQPRRFNLASPGSKAGRAGTWPTQAEIVILDESFTNAIFFYEHDLTWDPKFKRSGREGRGVQDQYEICPRKHEICPLCEHAEKDAYFVAYLTAIVFIPWTDSNGVEHPYRRQLVPVKQPQHEKFKRLEQSHGGLRGLHLFMARDNDQDPRIGEPEFRAKHNEDAIIKSFSHPEIKNNDGKVVKEANADCYPYDYMSIFHPHTADELAAMYNISKPEVAGSQQQVDQQWGNADPGQAAPPNGGGQANPISPAGSAASTEQQTPDAQPAAQGQTGKIGPTTPPQTTQGEDDLDDDIPF